MENEYQITFAESHTLMLLGVIAVRAGNRDAIYRTGSQVLEGKRSVQVESDSTSDGTTVDLVAWYSQTLLENRKDLLGRMRDFRNHLFHGVCVVDQSDGTLTVHDTRQNDCLSECKFAEDSKRAEYTVAEITEMAGWFVGLDIKRAFRMTLTTTTICRTCGITLPDDDSSDHICEGRGQT